MKRSVEIATRCSPDCSELVLRLLHGCGQSLSIVKSAMFAPDLSDQERGAHEGKGEPCTDNFVVFSRQILPPPRISLAMQLHRRICS